MMNTWNDWATSPPPLITCHVREGCTASVQLIVIDEEILAAMLQGMAYALSPSPDTMER